MFNNTLLNWTKKLELIAKETLNIDVDFSIGEMKIDQILNISYFLS